MLANYAISSTPFCGFVFLFIFGMNVYLKLWMLNNLQKRPKHHNSSILDFISFGRSFEHNQKRNIFILGFLAALLWLKSSNLIIYLIDLICTFFDYENEKKHRSLQTKKHQ